MKNRFKLVLAALMVLGIVAPSGAQADTDVFVSFNSPYRDGPRHYDRHRGPPPPRYSHRHWRPEPVFYAPPPYCAPPVRGVVYETTIVRPQAQYIVPASVMADQSSSTYVDYRGRTCREYTTTSWIGQAPQNVYGTACLQPDGAWRIVE